MRFALAVAVCGGLVLAGCGGSSSSGTGGTPPVLPPVANAGDPGDRQDAVHGGAGEDDAVMLGEHLGEVLTVEAGVGAGRQFDDPRCHGRV